MLRASKFTSIALLSGFAALTGCSHPDDGATGSAALGSANAQAIQAATAAVKADANMIVILKDQLPALTGASSLTARPAAVTSATKPLLAQLQATKPRTAKTFQLVNGFATTLSADEVAQLSADSTVLAVVPDAVMKLPKLSRADLGSTTSTHRGSAPEDVADLCNTLEPEALQLTNAAFLDPTTPQAQELLDGAGNKVTGQGVKVGIVADGFDPNVPGLIRADGTNVVVDYQDFSGDPAGTPTTGAEMFGDASSIAAQDTPNGTELDYDISKFVAPAHPLPSPCNIHVRGIAPGASLVGVKVFSNAGLTTNSGFVQAIEWAVVHDKVDILNESFGGNSYPDNGTDAISLANAAAVAAGVTVVVSSGDAGSSGTLGSPSTDLNVISAGATTSFRLYAQTNDGMYPLSNGYVSNNISSLSSGGFAQSGPRTPDLVAPGDLGWALCSTNATLFTECTDFNGNGTAVQAFGGTSEAAPLTSGAAALVLQAYRSTHGGATPSPALVKSILTGSAADLGASPAQQGSGILDALQAVNTALSIADDNGSPAPHAGGIVSSPSAANVESSPNAKTAQTFDITNTGSAAVTLTPALQALGPASAGQSLTVSLLPATAPTFINATGAARPYATQTFTVPAGVDHLDAAIAWPVVTGAETIVALQLNDPSGRQIAYSLPQGVGQGYGHVDVVKPAAGQWTAYMRTSASGISSYSGPVSFSWSAESFVSAGTVSPASVTIAPGAHAQVAATISAPSTPGDFAAALRLTDSASGDIVSSVPFTVRALIPVGSTGGTFAGALTGGNGRAGVSPTQTFAFDVTSGVHDMGLTLNLPDAGVSLTGYLVSPAGMILSTLSNVDLTGARTGALQMFRSAPQAGRWQFVLSEPQSSGKSTSIPFNGRIAFDSVLVSAKGMPSGTTLTAGTAVTVPVKLTNSGATANAFFADARTTSHSIVTLPTPPCTATVTTMPGYCGFTTVPPRTTNLSFTATSSVPIGMDVEAFTGLDILAKSTSANSVVASVAAPEIQFGSWYLLPAEVGPFGAGGEPTETITTGAAARIQSFDPTVTSDTGDTWVDQLEGTATYKPLVLAAGASGTINLTFNPAAALAGKTVSGYVYIDTYNGADSTASGDEVVGLPYSYTVSK
jgi:hypothetical protein